jgi:Fe2+ or Zn2+ uptake regulation protein
MAETMPPTAEDPIAPPPCDQELIDLLRGRGQRVTSQRLVLLRELRRRRRHATAEELRRAVSVELPGISGPTVYATLELLVELGLARKIDAGTGVSLFDGRTEPHQHLACRRCGAVEDLEAPFDPAPLRRAAEHLGFRVDRTEVVLGGVCARCSALGDHSSASSSAR